jgi:hypothetical protein
VCQPLAASPPSSDRRGILVEVKWLRVELPRERLDLVRGDGEHCALKTLADVQVLEVEVAVHAAGPRRNSGFGAR